jgi:Xaa-Pro aminopeptidase
MIDSSFFISNRQRLSSLLPEGLIILSAYFLMQQSSDSAFAFTQESNFWWLTGIEYPDWLLIIDGSANKTLLVSPIVSEVDRIFNGTLSDDEALAVSGVDGVITLKEFDELLGGLKLKHDKVYTIAEKNKKNTHDFVLNPYSRDLNEKLKKHFKDIVDCGPYISKLRAIKQPEEILAIEKAIGISVATLRNVKREIDKFDYEYQIEAELSYGFRKNGAFGHAYDPIVAAGKNACTLHYIRNDAPIKSGDMILIDAGAKVDGYSADITRTYIKGNAIDRQKQVYAAVERANIQIIDLIRPGLSFKDYGEKVDEIMKSELDGLGLLKNPDDYRKYFPHAISHGLGVDVHDSMGGYKEMMPGMVLTVEPGIYIPEENIGVRLEDDILVTDSGHRNLTKSLSLGL